MANSALQASQVDYTYPDMASGTSGFFTNLFDPMRGSQQYNSAQSAIDRRYNAEQAELARNFSHDEAKLQRDFEERMSNTAYSRAAADLKRAGLNPYLAAMGNAASTPAGAAGTAYQASTSGSRSSPSQGALSGMLGTFVSSAFSVGMKLLPLLV